MPEANRVLGFKSGEVLSVEEVERAYSDKIKKIDRSEYLDNVEKECLKLCVGRARHHLLERVEKDKSLGTRLTRYLNGFFSRVPVSGSTHVYSTSTTSSSDKHDRIRTSVICKRRNGVDETHYYVNGRRVSRPEYDDAVKMQGSLVYA